MTRLSRSLALCIALAPLFLLTIAGAANAQTGDKVRVAVLNFENNSSWTYWGDNLGRAAADELTTQLFKTNQFSIIERAQLDAILSEQDLGASGRVSAGTAAEIGRLLGAQLILTGSITQFSIERVSGGFRSLGASYSKAETILDVRLVDTNTGEIILQRTAKAQNGLVAVSSRAQVRSENSTPASPRRHCAQPSVRSWKRLPARVIGSRLFSQSAQPDRSWVDAMGRFL